MTRKSFLISMMALLAFGSSGFWYFSQTEIGRGWNERGRLVVERNFVDPTNRRCDIREYGASEHQENLSTNALNQALWDCSRKGGGMVVVPAGRWHTGAVKLASNTTLHLEEGAELIFTPDPREYLPTVFTRFQGMELYNYSPLIYGSEVENVAITGPGKLVGNGEERTKWDGGGDFGHARAKLYELAERGAPVSERIFGDQIPGLRPSFVQCVRCKDVLLDGFTVENGPFWTIHFIYSENIAVRHLTVNNWSMNTDGVVIDSSKNVLIEDSLFATGDDAISIKSGVDADGRRVAIPSENIDIRRIHVTKGNGGVALGSEMSGGIKNVTIRDSIFENTGSGFRMKANAGRGGFFENILVDNIEMNHIRNDAINIDFQYHSALKSKEEFSTVVRDVVIKNIHGSDILEAIIDIDGTAEIDWQGMQLENFHFERVALPVRIESARQVTLKDIHFAGTKNTSYVLEESQDIKIEDSQCQTQGDKSCVRVTGKDTKRITLLGMKVTGGRPLVLIEGSASKKEVSTQ